LTWHCFWCICLFATESTEPSTPIKRWTQNRPCPCIRKNEKKLLRRRKGRGQVYVAHVMNATASKAPQAIVYFTTFLAWIIYGSIYHYRAPFVRRRRAELHQGKRREKLLGQHSCPYVDCSHAGVVVYSESIQQYCVEVFDDHGLRVITYFKPDYRKTSSEGWWSHR